MPSPIGKAIDAIRLADRRKDEQRQLRGEQRKGDSIRKTVPLTMVSAVRNRARHKDDRLIDRDLDRIVEKVRTAFASEDIA